jgi:Uma2 family endonuclease
MGIAVSDNALERMSGADFRAFQEGRPDHERWELIAGVPMMMPTPSIAHNRIASNLERLLNDALARHDRSRLATQRLGIEIGSGDYRPEPDVAVIDADYAAEQWLVERCYLLAEIVSRSDEVRYPDTKKRWIEIKRDIYLAHPPCEAVLIIAQDRIEVGVDVRTPSGWRSETLAGADARLVLPTFGLTCLVGDLYDSTPLLPRVAR